MCKYLDTKLQSYFLGRPMNINSVIIIFLRMWPIVSWRIINWTMLFVATKSKKQAMNWITMENVSRYFQLQTIALQSEIRGPLSTIGELIRCLKAWLSPNLPPMNPYRTQMSGLWLMPTLCSACSVELTTKITTKLMMKMKNHTHKINVF